MQLRIYSSAFNDARRAACRVVGVRPVKPADNSKQAIALAHRDTDALLNSAGVFSRTVIVGRRLFADGRREDIRHRVYTMSVPVDLSVELPASVGFSIR